MLPSLPSVSSISGCETKKVVKKACMYIAGWASDIENIDSACFAVFVKDGETMMAPVAVFVKR